MAGMTKRIALVALLTGSMLLLGGCEQLKETGWLEQEETWKPAGNAAVSVTRDGQITEYLKDTLDEAYYSAAELQKMITAEVAEYNSQNGADSIVVEDFTAEGSKVQVTLTYQSAADYAEFNRVECYSGSMIGAQMAGYLFDTDFYRVRDGSVQETPVSGSAVYRNMAAEVLIITAPLEVHVPGTVVMTSANAQMLSADTVDASGLEAEREKEALVLPSNAVYEGEEKSFEERAAANRVYIIYE